MAGITVYTDELGDRICEEIATTSIGLRHICEKLDVAYSTVTGWIYNKEHPMSGKYAHAKRMQMEHMADEILEIADDGSNDLMTIVKGDTVYEQENKEVTNRSKLRVDSRRWLMSKLMPEKFGDKLDITTGGDKIQSTVPTITIINPNASDITTGKAE